MGNEWPTTCSECEAEFNIDYVSFPPDRFEPEDHPFTPDYCPFCGGEL
jgi:hypothetical protein